jgi:hypothetical protein
MYHPNFILCPVVLLSKKISDIVFLKTHSVLQSTKFIVSHNREGFYLHSSHFRVLTYRENQYNTVEREFLEEDIVLVLIQQRISSFNLE